MLSVSVYSGNQIFKDNITKERAHRDKEEAHKRLSSMKAEYDRKSRDWNFEQIVVAPWMSVSQERAVYRESIRSEKL